MNFLVRMFFKPTIKINDSTVIDGEEFSVDHYRRDLDDTEIINEGHDLARRFDGDVEYTGYQVDTNEEL